MNWSLARKASRLAARAEIVQQTRDFFRTEGYLEIDTPLLIPAPAPEAHIDAIQAGELYLHTSPEICMKRLLAAGYAKIFQICHCWRSGERGSRHLPEFTMLEWYRAQSDYSDLMTDCVNLIRQIATACGAGSAISYNGLSIDLQGEWQRITVREAFRSYTGTTMEKALQDGVFDELMTMAIEPNLGTRTPTFICDYPAERGALARLKRDDVSVAERFELYIAGTELANAFSELTDAGEQRQRFQEEAASRAERGQSLYPMPGPFLDELDKMPPSAGIALGMDRLIMLLTGAKTIDEVVAFTPEEL
ncbi:MAG TPA: EF-P lysine aminoacylase EpmA [Geobacteraceae bacterium]|nr:EF-P lysine aminoacylase EpmA [Geobacteraceae bacterium]